MRIYLLISLMATILSCFSQTVHDMIKVEDEYFLLYPSPILSLVQDSIMNTNDRYSSMGLTSDEHYSSLFELRNDSLFLIEFLAVNNGTPRFYVDSLYFDFTEAMFISVTGDFHLQHTNEWKKEIIRLKKPKNSFDVFDFANNDDVLHFIEGEQVIQIFSQNCENLSYYHYGRFTMIDYYWEWGPEHDSIIFENTFDSCKSYVFPFDDFSFIELPIGLYNIHMKNNNEQIIITIYNIQIKEDEITTLNYSHGYNGGGVGFSKYKKYSADNTFTTFDINLIYGQKSWVSANNSNLYSIGFQQKVFLPPGKKQSKFYIGSQYGFSYSYYNLKNDLIPQDYKHRYFSSVSFDLGVATRLYFSNRAKEYKPHAMIELGVYYKLPLYFRDIKRNGNMKDVDFQIHNFKEVILYGKIGATNAVSLIAEYRVFDVVNGLRPQLPKLQFGISIMIDSDM